MHFPPYTKFRLHQMQIFRGEKKPPKPQKPTTLLVLSISNSRVAWLNWHFSPHGKCSKICNCRIPLAKIYKWLEYWAEHQSCLTLLLKLCELGHCKWCTSDIFQKDFLKKHQHCNTSGNSGKKSILQNNSFKVEDQATSTVRENDGSSQKMTQG